MLLYKTFVIFSPIRVFGTTIKQLLIELVVLGTSCHSPIVAGVEGLAVVAHIAVVEEADAVDIVVATILSLVPINPERIIS